MFGMLIGAGLVIAGTIAVVRHHRGGGKSALLNCAFRRLKANEAQKQRLSALFDDAHVRLSTTKDRARALRRELADILSAPTVDGKQLENLEARLFEVLGEGTQVLREVVARTHETLEPQQRQQLADWLRRAAHHHHCHAAACH